MNLAFNRELELAQNDALHGDAEEFFAREERLIAMDIHGDMLQMHLLNQYKLIASFRTDRFMTAKELWSQMKTSMSRKDKCELWNQVWSVPEADTQVYEELVYAIMKDPNLSAGGFMRSVSKSVVFIVIVLGAGFWWFMGNSDSDSESGLVNTVIDREYIPMTSVVEEVTPTISVSNKVLYNTEELFKKASPSIVMFVGVAEFQSSEGKNILLPLGHGSGFYIDENGLVMTNKHVSSMFPTHELLDYCSNYGVEFRTVALYAIVKDPNPRHVVARVLFESPSIDLALIKLENRNQKHLQLAAGNPQIGSDVVVIGYRGSSMRINDAMNNEEKERFADEFALSDTSKIVEIMSPNKEFLPTLSSGKVSSIFSVPTEDKHHKYDVIEHSAATSGGNSGGPMLNMNNEVTGMLTWVGTSQKNAQGTIVEEADQAINLCIGVEEIRKVLDEWYKSQK